VTETIYSKILVPYDGSKYVEEALDKGVSLAKLTKGSEIIIINVIGEILAPPVVYPASVHHHKTDEVTTLSKYYRDLQTVVQYKMINSLGKVKTEIQKLSQNQITSSCWPACR
jgi:nucleotide-binding universal stress UspA family protein